MVMEPFILRIYSFSNCFYSLIVRQYQIWFVNLETVWFSRDILWARINNKVYVRIYEVKRDCSNHSPCAGFSHIFLYVHRCFLLTEHEQKRYTRWPVVKVRKNYMIYVRSWKYSILCMKVAGVYEAMLGK